MNLGWICGNLLNIKLEIRNTPAHMTKEEESSGGGIAEEHGALHRQSHYLEQAFPSRNTG